MAGVKGVKNARYDLIPPEATWYEALVYAAGAEKYAERNWEMGYEWGKNIAAIERHLQLFKAGEDTDEESGLPHMAHARWHTGALLTFQAREIGVDDRPHNTALHVMKAITLNTEDIKSAKSGNVVGLYGGGDK